MTTASLFRSEALTATGLGAHEHAWIVGLLAVLVMLALRITVLESQQR